MLNPPKTGPKAVVRTVPAEGTGDTRRALRWRETLNLFMGYIYTVYINIHIYI